jgi:pilus assembly protein CpaF
MNFEIQELHTKLIQALDQDTETESLDERINNAISSQFNDVEPLQMKRVRAELNGAGPIDALLSDSNITEILINGPSDIWFEKNGQLVSHLDRFISAKSYNSFLQRLYLEANVKPDLDRPFADGLWRGFRLHIILPPLSQATACLCLRRHMQSGWTLKKLFESNWCEADDLDKIKDLVHQKKNILIIGATSSGKTSVLNALLAEVQSNERCIAIEDTDEVKLPNTASAKLLSRVHASDVLRDYDLGDLLKQSLRMRPDRIIVGEVRGPEAKDLLMALATGHQGGMGTLHADSARQALLRLEMLIQLGAPQWPAQAIRHLIFLSLSHIIVVKKINGARKLDSIVRIASIEENGFCLE